MLDITYFFLPEISSYGNYDRRIRNHLQVCMNLRVTNMKVYCLC